MAATAAPVSADSKPIIFQTWNLKVLIHCQGCKRKVEKVLRRIDGVYATTIDSQQQMVTVTGNIEVEKLLKKLKKTGKHAEVWNEKVSAGKKAAARTSNLLDQDGSRSDGKGGDDGSKESVKFGGDGSSEEKENTDNSTAGNNEGGGRKKSKKGKKGNDAAADHSSESATSDQPPAAGYGGNMNQAATSTILNPMRPLSAPYTQGFCHVPSGLRSVPFPQGFCYVPSGIRTNINTAYPNGCSATDFGLAPAPSSVYENAIAHRAITPSGLDSLYIFSDENVDGCMIM